jgi:hypothetical protein
MGKFDFGFSERGDFQVSVDTNEDGEKLAELEIAPGEILDEIMDKVTAGEDAEIELDAKAVRLVAEGGRIGIVLDTNRDGEHSLKFNLNLSEVIDEIASARA